MPVRCSSGYKDNREDQGKVFKECGVGDFKMFVGFGRQGRKSGLQTCGPFEHVQKSDWMLGVIIGVAEIWCFEIGSGSSCSSVQTQILRG